jgi:predicted nucleotidyltransferase
MHEGERGQAAETVGIHSLITEKLNDVERAEQARVLYAVESGSRAWGFASPDSDYDVRFIYARPAAEYLRLDERRDVIEYELNDVLDINGWDIRKALRLFCKSNPTLFEWLGSPIVYRTTEAFESIRGLIGEYYQRKHAFCHYRSMAKKNYRSNFKDGEPVRLKAYFYVIRPILAAGWILQNGTPPPVAFAELADARLEPRMRPETEWLLAEKERADEDARQTRVAVWDQWIESHLANLENALPDAQGNPVISWDRMNAVFREIVCGLPAWP